MREISYILVPGLGDQKSIFGWFYYRVGKWWTRKGMHVSVFQPLWISTESYSEKYARLEKRIHAEQREGRGVVLVGVSAGATLVTLVMQRLKVPPVAVVSICGFIRLKESDRQNKQFMSLSWYRAGEAAERAIRDLTAVRRKRILCLIPKKDNLIGPDRQKITGAINHRMFTSGHLFSVIVALCGYRRTIKRFVDEHAQWRDT